ncbi:MAG: hypothetical protein QOG63_1939 [Thermoleophilaceae bacterium]|nr:hypothetical protein [Thermoleophilaceae bacterium]
MTISSNGDSTVAVAQPPAAEATAGGARFLAPERAALGRYLPGLDEQLAALPLDELERPGGPGLELFRAAGGPGLLVPTEHGGLGADAVDAVRVQRAIGARAPSLAVATTMHHFSVATLVELSRRSSGFEWLLLEAIATKRQLVASGFAEGRPGQGILNPYLEAERTDGGIRLSGAKKPCSLAHSMDLLTASVRPSADEIAVAVIPANAAGIERAPFWDTPILAGAESDEVRLTGVEISETMLLASEHGTDGGVADLEALGLMWFELLISASYLGIASGLAERAIAARKGSPGGRATVGAALEGAAAALEGAAGARAGEAPADALGRVLLARYSVQDTVVDAANRAAELLGGMGFIRDADVGYLVAASRPLAFHPPSRWRMEEPLADFLAGQPLRIV